MRCDAGNQIFREIYPDPIVIVALPFVTGFVTQNTIHNIKLTLIESVD